LIGVCQTKTMQEDSSTEDLLLGIKNLAECFVGTYEYSRTVENESSFSSVLHLNDDGTFSLSGSTKTESEQIITTFNGKWEIQQRSSLDLPASKVSLRLVYATCHLLFRTEQKIVKKNKSSVAESYNAIFYREGRLENHRTGLISIDDETFGSEVILQGVPERIALQLEILRTPIGSFEIDKFSLEMKDIFARIRLPAEAFNVLKTTLIRIEYKIYHLNLAVEAFKSLLVLGDMWVEKFHSSPNDDYVSLMLHIVSQSYEAIQRLKESREFFERIQELKQSILRWEQYSSEYLCRHPLWSKQISQVKLAIDHTLKEHTLTDEFSLKVDDEELTPFSSFSPSSSSDETTVVDVEAIKRSPEYQRLQKLVEEQKQWIRNRVQELIRQIETDTYPFKKTKLPKYK
jgi:hypothetical protein